METKIVNQCILTESEKFLYSIGILKKQKENFLSDIVRAISLYNECFLNDFFKFCFPQKEDIKAYSIDRETTCFSKNDKNNNGRNDFFFLWLVGRPCCHAGWLHGLQRLTEGRAYRL